MQSLPPPRPDAQCYGGCAALLATSHSTVRATPFGGLSGRSSLLGLGTLALSASRLCNKRTICPGVRSYKRDELQDLCTWLKQIGTKGVDDLRLDASMKEDGGLAAFAKRDFAPGEVVCLVPEQGILVGEQQEGLLKEACLARALLREKELGSESFFAPYIRCLPTESDLPSIHPYFWPPGLDLEDLMAGSAHGRRVAREIFQEGSRCAALPQDTPHRKSQLEEARDTSEYYRRRPCGSRLGARSVESRYVEHIRVYSI